MNAEQKCKRIKRFKFVASIIGGIGLLGLLIGCFVFITVSRDENYKKVYYNPPTINYIEEDLEEVFMTTFVVVYNEDDEGDSICYDVKANGLFYRVLYVIKRNGLVDFKWGYKRHIQIGDIEDE